MSNNVVPLFKEEPPTSATDAAATTPDAPALVIPGRVPWWARSRNAIAWAVTHERTRAVGRGAVRNGMYVLGGARITTRRAWESRTPARYERLARAAEVAGDYEAAMKWDEQGQRFRAMRHKRRMDLLHAPEALARGLLVGTGATFGGLLLLGIILAIGTKHVADVVAPLMLAIETIKWIVVIVTVVWGPAMAVGPLLALAGFWAVGRKRQAAPNWTLPAADRSGGDPITPSIVVKAMHDLGIAPMRTAIKEMGDAGAAMLSLIKIAGCGVEVDVTLPSGVTTTEVQNRRRKLAENLGRHEHEVFITIPPAPRTVRLWIADSGALDEPIGRSPLVTDETLRADYIKGRAPWGQDLRGDAALLGLFQLHLLITGLSNQGKTAALRALALWLAMDPRAEFWIADLKGVGDWRMFLNLAAVLIEGPTDEHCIEATEMLERGVAEMERRLQSPEGTDFPPLILIVDEAQQAFMCPVKDEAKNPYGGSKATSRYFMAARKIHNQGRAVNVLLWQGTQDPTDQNLPKLVREGAHTRASLALGSESQSRMALGDKAVDGGAAPHLLRQGLDKGTLVVSSAGIDIPAGQSSITVRTHYIDTDEATVIADRAKALRDGVDTARTLDRGEQRDPLADIATVVGTATRVLTQDVLKRLNTLDSGFYNTWTFLNLKRVLEGTGAEPYKSDGRMVIARERLARALANRSPEDSASGPA
ncbi:cell division protein FtsK [Mangrovactinospora gilvigrisea]|uniref:Cell division protein FtsK n=1 Tax=Mangrovactinospora gilvigrisea TaxID=1428644 RepID=A0A1J7BGP6_9ACTN|nr:cell division protein FtsK [Mangrovactinospora gilvigrisea]OIV37859.1 cell division protein FtsK [Mangrovactinospora gilvigrisea]